MSSESKEKTDSIEGTKKGRGKAAHNSESSGNGGATSRMSPVRGNDHTDQDHLRRMGLPRMPTSSPLGTAQEIPDSGHQMGAKLPVTYQECSLEERVSLLNAYRKLLKKPISLKADPVTESIIRKEYISWVTRQMDLVFQASSGGVAPGFNAEEYDALKVLAGKIVNSAKAQPKPPVSMSPPPGQDAVPRPKTPLKEAVDVKAFHTAQTQLLEQLRQMEQNGPDF